MKTLRILTLLAALSLSIVSCTKDIAAPENFNDNCFIAEAPLAKLSLEANYSLSWNAGDSVSVYDGTSTYTFKAENAGAKTNLVNPDVTINPELTYYAVYPVTGSKFENADSLVITIPSSQNFTSESFKYSYGVAVSSGASKKFEFKNVASLVAFEITETDIVKVVIQGRNSEALTGTVKADCIDGSYKLVAGGSREVVLSSDTPLATGYHYAAILPQNYANGLAITLTKSDGTNTVRRIKGFELTRSSYIDLEKLDESRNWAHYISTPAELKAFLEDAPSLGSDYVATLGCDIDLSGVTIEAALSFEGTLDGAGFAIKNWSTKTPLFEEISGGAVVKDLTFNNCYYTVNTTREYDAFLVGINEGTVSGCINNGKLATPSGIKGLESNKNIAGLVALNRNSGKVINCVNNGRLPIYTKAYAGKNVWVGGVVAQTCPTDISEPSVKGCTNNGEVIFHAQRAKAPIFLGGVLGGSSACVSTTEYGNDLENWGSIDNCTNGGIAKIQIDDLSDSKANSMNCYNLGGVVGYFEGSVTNCTGTDKGSVIFDSPLVGASTFRYGRVAVGGIVGYVSESITNCTNSAPISITGRIGRSDLAALSLGAGATWKDSMFGGIAGYAGNNTGSTTVESCTNNGNISFSLNQPASEKYANISIGGIVGISKSTISNGANTGNIEGQSDVHFHYIGGIVGRSTYAITNMTNSGNIVFDNLTADKNSDADQRSWQSFVGGISGLHSVKSYTTAIDNCFNTGNITFKNGLGERKINATTTTKQIQMVGGIAGVSTGLIVGNKTNRAANTGNITALSMSRFYLGGIAGEVCASVTYCDNSGTIVTTGVDNAGITNSSMVGGVIGAHFASYKCSVNAETAAYHGQGDGKGVVLIGSNTGDVIGAQLDGQSGFGLITGKFNAKTDADGNFYWYDSVISGNLAVTGDQTKVGFISGGGLGCTKIFCGKEGETCSISNVKLNGTAITTMEAFNSHLGFAATLADMTYFSFAE